MESSRIKELIDKYFEGNTSVEEERQLNALIKGKQLPKEYSYLIPLFDFYEEERNKKPELKFSPGITIAGIKHSRSLRYIWMAAAACILLLLGIFILQNRAPEQVVYAYINGIPVTDEQLAIEETKKALSLISTNLNQGTTGLNYLSEINKTKQLITKNQ
jgi:hypothetical protein